MAGKGTLAERIAALAKEEPRFEERMRQVPVGSDALEALLDEIDTSVLAAELTFETEKGAVTVTAASRRLLSVTDVSEGVTAPEGLIGATLTMDAKAQVEAAAKLLGTIAGGAKTLRVRMAACSDTDLSGSPSVNALRGAIGLVVDDPDATAMERFLARTEKETLSLLLLKDGAVAKTKGSIQLLQTLKVALSTQVEAFMKSRADTCHSHTDPSLTLCYDTIEQGVGMAIAVHGTEMAIFAFESGAISRIGAAWQRVI